MNEEHDGTPSEEEYQRFRKMMDGMGRDGLRRMVEHLTERIEANPRDTDALSARGLAYGELGEHRLAAEDNGTAWRWRTHRPGEPRQCGRPPRQGVCGPAPGVERQAGGWRSTATMWRRAVARTTTPPSAWLSPLRGDAVAHYSRGACKADATWAT